MRGNYMNKLVDEVVDLKLREFRWPWGEKSPSSDVDKEIEKWSTQMETWKKVVVKLFEDSENAAELVYRKEVLKCEATKDAAKSKKCYDDLFITTSKVAINYLKKNIGMCKTVVGEEYQKKCFEYVLALIKKRKQQLREFIKKSGERKCDKKSAVRQDI